MQNSDTNEKAFSIAMSHARAGDPAGQLAVGQMLLNGIGVPRSETGALHWFLAAAAAANVPMACNMVGRCCELGWGTPRNMLDAMIWYKRAATLGLDWGMYNYATGLSLGWGGDRDLDGALSWFRRAAALGHCKSFNMIGTFYEDGWAVGRNRARARAYYARGARCGDFRAHFNFGRFLRDEGRGAEAEHHFSLARDKGTVAFVAKMDDFFRQEASAERNAPHSRELSARSDVFPC